MFNIICIISIQFCTKLMSMQFYNFKFNDFIENKKHVNMIYIMSKYIIKHRILVT